MEQNILDVSLDKTINSVKSFNDSISKLGKNLGNISTIAQNFGVNLGSLGKGLSTYSAVTNLATKATEGQTVAMKMFNAALGPIGLALGALVSVYEVLSSNIKGNEDATNKLQIVLAKFKPVLDGITKAIGIVADVALSFADSLANQIPKAVKIVGPVIVKLAQLFNSFVGTVTKGIDAVGEFVGLDLHTSKLSDGISDIVSGMESFIKNIDSATEKSVKFERDRQQAIKDTRIENQQLEQSLARQAELQNSIASTLDPVKRKAYFDELKKEIAEEGALREKQAKRTAELEERRQSFSPSTTSEIDYANQLKIAAAHESTLTTQKLAAVEKRETMINKLIAANDKKSAQEQQKNIEQALKEQEKAELEAAKRSKAIVKQAEDEIKIIKTDSRYNLEDHERELNRQKELGILRADTENTIQAEIQSIKLKGLKDEIDAYQLAIDDENVLEEDRITLLQKLSDIKKEIAKTEADYKVAQEIRANDEISKAIETASTNSFNLLDTFGTSGMSIDEVLKPIEDVKTKLQEDLDAGIIAQETYNARLEELLLQETDIRNKYADQAELTEAKKQEAIKRAQDETLKITSKAFSDLGKIMSNNAKNDVSAKKASLDRQLEFNQITQEQYDEQLQAADEQGKAQFERGKQIQIASAIVSTLSGAVESQMAVWKTSGLPFWAALPLSIATGLQTLQAGYQQIEQIKNQTWDGSGSSSSLKGSSLGATSFMSVGSSPDINPIIDENRDLESLQTIPVQQEKQDQRVYILESDIQTSNNRVAVRENNAMF